MFFDSSSVCPSPPRSPTLLTFFSLVTAKANCDALGKLQASISSDKAAILEQRQVFKKQNRRGIFKLK